MQAQIGDLVRINETFVAKTKSGRWFKRFVAGETHPVTPQNVDFINYEIAKISVLPRDEEP